jgi:hypothetical protein
MVDKGIGIYFGKQTLRDYTYIIAIQSEDKRRLELSKRISIAGGVSLYLYRKLALTLLPLVL